MLYVQAVIVPERLLLRLAIADGRMRALVAKICMKKFVMSHAMVLLNVAGEKELAARLILMLITLPNQKSIWMMFSSLNTLLPSRLQA